MLRTLSFEEITFVSGGMFEDADSFDDGGGGGGDYGSYGDQPDSDGSYASQYPDDEYYKTPTYVDGNGDIVITAPQKDPLSNYDWTSYGEVTAVTGAAAIASFGASAGVTAGVFAAGAAAGSPPATKALDQANRYIYHNIPTQPYNGGGMIYIP